MTIETAEPISSIVPRGEPAAPINAGEIIDGKYLVGECIAWGGMGVVTEATHLHLQKAVALKCIRPEYLENDEIVARFLNEARIAANLRNEHVARVLDFGKTEAGVPYLVMERLEGMSLAAVVGERGPLPVTEAVDYLLQACEAIAEAHAQGIVHRDIKPENLFLTQGVDGAPFLKVLDFGISKQLLPETSRALTNPSTSMGSPCYMSPEQMRNAQFVDTRTDVWAMGAVLFELLAAKPPFDGTSMPEICAHVLCDAPRSLKELRPEVAPGLEAVVDCCLQKDREKRFTDVAELARALEPYASPNGRASIPSIENIASNVEAPRSAERRQSAADASASFAPTVLEPPRAAAAQEESPDPAAVDALIGQIPGVRSRWPWFVAVVVVIAAGGAGAAHYLGYDVLAPARGVLIPAALHQDAPDARLVRGTIEPQFGSKRGPARAEPEREATITAPASSPGAATASPKWMPRSADTSAEAPHEMPLPPDDPYVPPPAP